MTRKRDLPDEADPSGGEIDRVTSITHAIASGTRIHRHVAFGSIQRLAQRAISIYIAFVGKRSNGNAIATTDGVANVSNPQSKASSRAAKAKERSMGYSPTGEPVNSRQSYARVRSN
jgi:hypothetical protein